MQLIKISLKRQKMKKLNSKADYSKDKLSEATTLIYVDQYNNVKQNLWKKIPDTNKCLVINTLMRVKYQMLVIQLRVLLSTQNVNKLRTKYQMLVI